MRDVPKIVQFRLQRQTPVSAEPHPDADLLTAFAEQSLSGRERDHVLEHLARCRACRDVVALALPATEVVAFRSGTAERSRWLSWPSLRMGLVAAGIVIVGSVGVLQYRERHQEKMALATRVAPANQLSDKIIESPLPATPPTPRSTTPSPIPRAISSAIEASNKFGASKKTTSQLHGADTLDKRALPATLAPGRVNGAYAGTIGGPISRTRSGSGLNGRNFTALVTTENSAPTAAPKENPLPITGASTSMDSGSAPTVSIDAASRSATPDQPAANQGSTQTSAVQQKAVIRAKASPAVPAPSDALSSDSNLMKNQASARWTISPAGVLQRSLDGGRTWVDISVNSTPAPANAMSFAGQLNRSADGSIAGFVTDPSGAVIPGASVTLANLTTLEKRTQSTDSDGHYTFANLAPGEYRLDVEEQGFKTLTQSTIALNAQQKERFDAQLQTGAVSETVEVNAAAPVLQTEALSAGNAEVARKSETRQPGKRKDLERQKTSLSTFSPVFHALAANGPEVWAGGSGGALYHTLDGGNLWVQVVPSNAGVALTGDIVGIQFPDQLHGTVTTSSGEVWITNNAGQSWQKQ